MTAAASLALVAVSLLSFFGAGTWPGELTTHFRPTLAAASLLLALWTLVRRRWALAVLVLAAAVSHGVPLLPYVRTPEEAAAPGVPFRVLAFNLHHDRADPAALAALLEAERPDLVVLTELEPSAEKLLKRVRTILPTVLRPERRGSFEVALLTSWRVDGYEVDRSADVAFPVARVRLCRELCVDVVALHAATPFHGLGHYRAAQFSVAASWMRAAGDRKLVLGDLNATPWSPAFERLLDAGLRDSGLGRGIRPTWFSRIPGVGLPIDHVLVGPGIGVAARRVGPDLGSDHFPVLADLVLRGE